MIADELRRQADVFTDLVERNQSSAAIPPSVRPSASRVTRRNSCSARDHEGTTGRRRRLR
jgi:hypothetical protein